MLPQLRSMKLTPAGMLIVVHLNFGVTVKAQRDAILERVVMAFGLWNDVV